MLLRTKTKVEELEVCSKKGGTTFRKKEEKWGWNEGREDKNIKVELNAVRVCWL
jgi:hypothetical protein